MRLLAILLLFSLISFSHFAAALPFGKKEIIIRKLLPPEASSGGVERIAVMAIKKDETNQLAPELSRYLAEAGDFQLLAADQVAGSLAEAQIDPNTFQEVGRLLDVEAVLYSSVHIFKISDSEHQEEIRVSYQEEYYDKKGEKWKKRTKYKNVTAQGSMRRGLLEVEFELLDAVSGRVLAQTTKEANYHWVKLYDDRAPKEKKKTLPERTTVERLLVQDVLTHLSHHIAPYNEEITLEWNKECKGDACDSAYKALKKDDFVGAAEKLKAVLEKVLTNTAKREREKGKDKTLGSIYYNLGLTAEAKGDLPLALDFYEKAHEARAKKLPKHVKKAIERLSGDIARWAAYRQRTEKLVAAREVVWSGDYQPGKEALDRGEWQAAVGLLQTVQARSKHYVGAQENIQAAQVEIAKAKALAEAAKVQRRQKVANAAALKQQQEEEDAKKERDRQAHLNAVAVAFEQGKRAFERGNTYKALAALEKVEQGTPHFAAAQSMLGQTRKRAQEAQDKLRGLNLNYSASADFFRFIQQSDLSNLELFAAAGTDLDQSANSGGNALSLAVASMRADLLDRLLAVDADINAVSANGNTPLTEAVAVHSVWGTQALLFRGADPRRANLDKQSPLKLATETLKAARLAKAEDTAAALEVITYLLGTAEVVGTDSPQAIATVQLFFAVFTLDVEALQIHLANGANVNALGIDGNTPLMQAAISGYAKTVTVLLSHGAKPQLKNKAGETAAMLAARQGHAEIEKILASAGTAK